MVSKKYFENVRHSSGTAVCEGFENRTLNSILVTVDSHDLAISYFVISRFFLLMPMNACFISIQNNPLALCEKLIRLIAFFLRRFGSSFSDG